ncbi:hypothetical protein [Solidesulfovibrio magneticus]|uniref:Phosphoribosyltransferase domain-containing protein n=1 Tax=Solidesulfovibrio magneticus (strain ATCC 700980 / DSM 13731 / RS-1) TaxID=573370 RepID=C4XTH2_SOLM1|nr:hypothetical protein [Solidesulfovibrio magneticus]BAH75969.1 hypothetical protein DMR_24780 [Solidesulfovibrio magneticus RS-1]
MSTAVFTKNRSIFWLRINENDDGSYAFFVSDAAQRVLNYHFPILFQISPTGWKDGKSNVKYIWIPKDRTWNIDIESIKKWADFAVNHCVWIDCANEIEYCVACDFNFEVINNEFKRTPLGLAEFKIKYRIDNIPETEKATHLNLMYNKMCCAFDLLPLRYKPSRMLFGKTTPPIITSIPANTGKGKLAWNLAKYIARQKSFDLVEAQLLPPKPEMKNLRLQEKITTWLNLYQIPMSVSFNGDMRDREIVIVDDLYQSGATMQAYAKHLKSLGVRDIYGLACVKSMRDSDNQ